LGEIIFVDTIRSGKATIYSRLKDKQQPEYMQREGKFNCQKVFMLFKNPQGFPAYKAGQSATKLTAT
jgi:hypothetical protein